jgi:hypothetical protein
MSVETWRPGHQGKLYFCAAGIGGTPEWTELSNARDVTVTSSTSEVDLTTRGNGGHKATGQGLEDDSIEFEMIFAPGDAGFQAVQTAKQTRAAIGLAAMSGDIETAGSEGLVADCCITQFAHSQPLDGPMTVRVTAKPTASATPPYWMKVTAQE